MKYFLLYSLFFCCSVLNAQNNKTDSLLALIKKARTDTARINLMNKVSSRLTENNIDSAFLYAKQTATEAQRIHYTAGEGIAHSTMAEALIRKSNFAEAKKEIEIAETLIRKSGDSGKLATIYSTYGMMYGMQSKYDSSTLYYKRNISLLQNSAEKKKLSKSYQNIAVNYQMQSDFRQAIYYQTKALELAEAGKDTNTLAYISVNMGITYESLENRPKAEEFYLKSVQYAKAAGIKNVELYAYTNLASFYEETDYKKAYTFAMQAANLGEQTGDSAIAASSLAKAANSLANQGDFIKAESLDAQAIRIAELAGQPLTKFQAFSVGGFIKKRQQQCGEAIPLYEKAFTFLQESDLYVREAESAYFSLSDCYESTGNIGQALVNYKKASRIKDSISSRDNIRKATELSMQYDFDKEQQRQQAERTKEDRENTIKLLFLIGFLVVFIALSTSALIAYRREQKAKKLVDEQKNQIEVTLNELKATQAQLIQSEKMASLGELTAGIAHEIQNPLNFVNNFSELNSEMIEELKAELLNNNPGEAIAIADHIKANEEKIAHHGKRADAIVKGMLQHSRKNGGQKERTGLNDLCEEYLRLAYHGMRAKDKNFHANLSTLFDENIKEINLVPQDVGRVLLNLFNNAFYAVRKQESRSTGNYQPSVDVVTRKADNGAEVIIMDNGNGIPQSVIEKIFQPFFTTKPAGEGTGLGLSMSYDIITKEHNGTIRVESKEGQGTSFIITLPQ